MVIIDTLMGEYEIYCDKERNLWRVANKLSCVEWTFKSLDELLELIKDEVEAVEIEEGIR